MRFQQNNKFNTKNKLKFIFLISLLFLIVPPSLNAQKKYVVVLDAGHGGKDPGNLGNGYQEKNIALKIALLVGNNLKKNNIYWMESPICATKYEKDHILSEMRLSHHGSRSRFLHAQLRS